MSRHADGLYRTFKCLYFSISVVIYDIYKVDVNYFTNVMRSEIDLNVSLGKMMVKSIKASYPLQNSSSNISLGCLLLKYPIQNSFIC